MVERAKAKRTLSDNRSEIFQCRLWLIWIEDVKDGVPDKTEIRMMLPVKVIIMRILTQHHQHFTMPMISLVAATGFEPAAS